MIWSRLKKAGRGVSLTGGVMAVVGILATGCLVASATADPAGSAVPASLTSGLSSGRPPAPVITHGPPDQTFSATAKFTYADRLRPVTFHCYLNSPPASTCSPQGITYHLPIGGLWCFYVYVTSAAGKASLPARWCWAVLYRPLPFPFRHRHRPRPVRDFTVGGNLTAPLAPGVSEPLDLTFTNPNLVPITIQAGGVTGANIAISTNVAACTASNFEVSQGLVASVTIPARTTTPVSLLSAGIPQADWPVITMLNTSSNQDACQGATLTLQYSGIEATG